MKVILFKDISQFISSLEKPTRSKWARLLDLLVIYGGELGMPHARRIDSSLSELRIRGSQEIRAFYTQRGEYLLILHAFIKKTNKIPIRELQMAQKRLRDIDNI